MMEMVNLFKRLDVGCTLHSFSLTYVITGFLRRYTYCWRVLFIPVSGLIGLGWTSGRLVAQYKID
jgi:hypothetical protein